MSVISCHERKDKRGGGERDDSTHTAKRTYLLETNSATDGRTTILSYPGLPQLFDAYDVSGDLAMGMRVLGREAEQIGPTQWEAAITYDSKRERKEPEAETQDISGWKIGVTLSSELKQAPLYGRSITTMFHDTSDDGSTSPTMIGAVISGVGMINSAFEPFDPPVMVDETIWKLTFAAAVMQVDVATAARLMNSVNSDFFFGGLPRQWRITQYDTPGQETKQIGGLQITHNPVTIVMQYARDTHDIQVLDNGLTYLDKTTNPWTRHSFLTKEGTPYIGLLDGEGGKLADTATEAKFIRRRHYPEIPFSNLGLPGDFPEGAIWQQ